MPHQRSSIFLCWLLLVPAGATAGDDVDLCRDAAERAAFATGVPEALLQAMTLVETRYSGVAWPWTVNVDGAGSWYPDRAQAEAAARRALDRGSHPDVGCFQINTYWHGAAFPSVDSMFDPETNARYAADFLLDLYSTYGNWSDAVAAYHSRDADRGADYLARVAATMADGDAAVPGTSIAVRRNEFPLLVSGDPATAGSVVPRLPGRAPLVGGP